MNFVKHLCFRESFREQSLIKAKLLFAFRHVFCIKRCHNLNDVLLSLSLYVTQGPIALPAVSYNIK